MREMAKLRQQATKLVGEGLALAQEGNFAELLRRDELEANELRTRLATRGSRRSRRRRGGSTKSSGGSREPGAKGVPHKGNETSTSHGIASLGPEETQEAPPPLPSREWNERGKSKATELDFPTFTERIRGTARGGRADAYGVAYEHYKPLLSDHAAAEALGRFANLIATYRMHKPGGGEVRNQRQTPTATNGHNTQTTRGSYTGSTRQGKPEKQWSRRSLR